MGTPKLPTRILNFFQKNKWWTLLIAILGGIILFQKAVEATGKLWDTRKLFYQAKQDTDAIADLRAQVQKQKDALDLLVRDSNTAYTEIAEIKQQAAMIVRRLAPRTLNPSQVAILKAFLSQRNPKPSFPVSFRLEAGAETKDYAREITAVFYDARWEARLTDGGNDMAQVYGLVVNIDFRDSDLREFIERAFKAANIPYKLDHVPSIMTSSPFIIGMRE